MTALRRLLGVAPAKCPFRCRLAYEPGRSRRSQPAEVLRGIAVTWTLHFNDVLDADKLHTSLSELLEIGDWRKIGGRLKLKKNGKLETHVPHPFSPDRPAISYTHRPLAVNFSDHPLAKTLPNPTAKSSIQPRPQDFRAFAAREEAPETLEDILYQDTPQLSLHITSFNDATLVALSWASKPSSTPGPLFSPAARQKCRRSSARGRT